MASTLQEIGARVRELASRHRWVREGIERSVDDMIALCDRRRDAEIAQKQGKWIDLLPPDPFSMRSPDVPSMPGPELRVVVLYWLGGLADSGGDLPLARKPEPSADPARDLFLHSIYERRKCEPPRIEQAEAFLQKLESEVMDRQQGTPAPENGANEAAPTSSDAVQSTSIPQICPGAATGTTANESDEGGTHQGALPQSCSLLTRPLDYDDLSFESRVDFWKTYSSGFQRDGVTFWPGKLVMCGERGTLAPCDDGEWPKYESGGALIGVAAWAPLPLVPLNAIALVGRTREDDDAELVMHFPFGERWTRRHTGDISTDQWLARAQCLVTWLSTPWDGNPFGALFTRAQYQGVLLSILGVLQDRGTELLRRLTRADERARLHRLRELIRSDPWEVRLDQIRAAIQEVDDQSYLWLVGSAGRSGEGGTGPAQRGSRTLRGEGGGINDWRKIQGLLFAKQERGDPYVSLRTLAAEFNCSEGLIRKVIDKSDTLKAWQERTTGAKAAPRATDLSAVVRDNTRQTTEPAPDDVLPDDERDAALAQLMDKHPEARAQINAMSDEDKAKAARLWIEQEADAERSSLRPEVPAGRLRSVKHHKRA